LCGSGVGGTVVVGKVDATGWLVCRGDRNNVGVLEYVERVERVEREERGEKVARVESSEEVKEEVDEENVTETSIKEKVKGWRRGAEALLYG
jgi:hypothetical protein